MLLPKTTANRHLGSEKDSPGVNLRCAARTLAFCAASFFFVILHPIDVGAETAYPGRAAEEVVLTGEERAWLDVLYDEVGYIDSFRLVNQEAEQYTWWSNRGRAWDKNVGWRLDYQVISPKLADKVCSAAIYKDERFSDHAPQIMEYELELAG